MTTRMVTPAVGLAVSLNEAKDTLRLDVDELDASIARWVRGITMSAEHETGRAFISQGWRVTLDAFPDAIRLDKSPVVSVESVRFYDADDVLQTLDPADYYVDMVTEPGYVIPAAGRAWPATSARANAVMVDFTCGYGESHDEVPDAAQIYILARLAEQFDPATGQLRDSPRSDFVTRLLDGVKVY